MIWFWIGASVAATLAGLFLVMLGVFAIWATKPTTIRNPDLSALDLLDGVGQHKDKENEE